MHRQNIRSFLFFAAQTRCNSAGEMHVLVKSMSASSFGVAGMANSMTAEIEFYIALMSIQNISRKRI